MRILLSTILMAGVLGIFAVESAAKDKKPKGTAVTCGAPISASGNYFSLATALGQESRSLPVK